MSRFKLIIEFDGADYVGWQRQANGPSIQEALEDAVFALSGERTEVAGAGRTDAGVHALAMAAHVDLQTDRFDADTVRKALNFHLREQPISVLSAAAVDPEFHARFSATQRRYLYRILNRSSPPALEAGRVWFMPRPLDAAAMAAAAAALLGRHDFTSFRGAHCQAASAEKTLDRLDVSRAGDEIHVIAEARSFLHHQVRNFVGTLALVGEGKWTRRDVERALAARDRAAAGPTAPAAGLYLLDVVY
ncbi:MAG: tRNA pseudouridine(38-40) synthase TruA [Proteobacteria bacterium]|nr:tRNA pseudouridine(38-40) synthase TruA [Pseudomonadota bacterium]MDA1310927.1 tRNA pseudouridine(38-40) synthase TruA [Pseudomonadota bacterium]